jgi:hypothetical protein
LASSAIADAGDPAIRRARAASAARSKVFMRSSSLNSRVIDPG